ncbi:MAG: DUF262 domain-containing protein [Crocinitomicaceae bacterium]|nr:DUF262 domain-containing protein [Crocinitomicaceae bacterium]
MQASRSTINDIFNQNKVLEIPFFQRSYVWNDDQWERFLEDMEMVSETNKPYFLGSVILKQQPTQSNQSVGDRRTVIDGQQRLTTLSIFFKVLSLKLQNAYFNNIFRLPLANNQIALQHNHNDIEAFNRVQNLEEEVELKETDHISRAYEYFRIHLDTNSINPQNILTNIMFVGIDLSHDDDEQQIFDTINSLGVKLTTAELLKNYFFGRNDYDAYLEYWQNVFEANDDCKEYWDTEIVAGRIRRHFIDLFFYSFLQIKIQDSQYNVSTEDKKLFTKVDGLFDSYKRFMQEYAIDKTTFIKEIKEYALLFKDNFDLSVLDSELPASSGMERMNAIVFGLENTTLIPYLLFVLKNVTDKNEQSSIFSFLEAYIMRRMVCHANTKNYNSLFSENLILNRILSRDSLKQYLENRATDNNYLPSDNDLKEGFLNSRLVNKQSTGILYFLESKARNRNLHSTGLLGLKSYTLEHVMPKKWENNWPAVNSPEEKNRRYRVLMTLGNLTILPSSLNSSIRDGAWDVKKNGTPTKPGLIQYAAGLETFSQYLQNDEWNESTIVERSVFLADLAIDFWSIQ